MFVNTNILVCFSNNNSLRISNTTNELNKQRFDYIGKERNLNPIE